MAPKTMKISTTNVIFNTFLKLSGYKAITSPWSVVYVLPGHETNQHLLAHEQVHLSQVQRLGSIKYTILYLWYNLRYGYWNNPLEVEARQVSGSN